MTSLQSSTPSSTISIPPPSNGKNIRDSRAPAATIAGFMEIGLFHPFDTVAKRLMTNRGSLAKPTVKETMGNLNEIVFKTHAHDNVLQKVLYLYPGSFYAVIYKVFQRTYKFAGQPVVREYLLKHHDDSFQRTFGRSAKVMREGTAGCLIGMGEVFLLPLDRLKVLYQVNEAAMNKGLFSLLRQEGFRGMYAGTGITICRNAPGSFALFGGASFAKHVLLGLEDGKDGKGEGGKKETVAQNIFASTVGACLSITVSNPMDVIKTRVQHATRDTRQTAVQTIFRMLKEEGIFTPFFKGLTPKIVASAPKLVFTYSMVEFLFQHMQTPKK